MTQTQLEYANAKAIQESLLAIQQNASNIVAANTSISTESTTRESQDTILNGLIEECNLSISKLDANTAIKIASAIIELKSTISTLEAKIETLESESSGSVYSSKEMICVDDGNTYIITVIVDSRGAAVKLEAKVGGTPSTVSKEYFYGSDGFKYLVKVIKDDRGDPVLGVEKTNVPSGSKINKMIKFAANNGATYAMKVVKPGDDEATIDLSPYAG